MRLLSASIVTALLLLAWWALPALAQKQYEPPQLKPMTVEEAATAVVEAFRGGDHQRLRALAERDSLGPWLVADEICFRGEHDAAEAFAKAAPRVDVEELPAYVAAWRQREPDTDERGLLAAMIAALRARALQTVVEGTDSLDEPLDTAVRIRLAHVRGIALQRVRRLSESEAVLRRAGDAARALGWLRLGSYLYDHAGRAAYQGGALSAARTAWELSLALCTRRGDQQGTGATLVMIGVVHKSLGNYAKALSTYEQALAVQEALGNRAGVAMTLGNIGNVHKALGNYDHALSCHQQALSAQEALGDRAGVARTLGNTGNVHKALGDYTKALSTLERALSAQEALDDKAGAAKTLANIGNVQSLLGNYAKALSIYEEALTAQEALGDKVGAATTLGNIGNIHGARGDYAKALSTLKRALVAKETLGDRAGAAMTGGSIGNVHRLLGDYAQALSTYERVLAAKEALGDKAGAAATLGNIGIVYDLMGDYTKALLTYERALAAKEALGDKAGSARTLGNIGTVYDQLGDYREALSIYRQVLAAKEALGDKAGAATTLGNISNVHCDLGDYAKALSIYEKAFAAKDALGDKAGAAMTLGNIGVVYKLLGDYAKALSIYEKALAAQGALGDKAGAAMTLGNIGNVYRYQGDYDKALSTYAQALATKEALGDRAGAAMTLGNIGIVYRLLRDYTKALSIYEKALAAQDALGDKVGAARTLGNIGKVHSDLGDLAKALSTLERALAAKEALGDRAGAVTTLGNVGRVHHMLGDHAKALSFVRRAVVQLGSVVSGLGAEAGAGAREPHAFIYDVGAGAALAQGDAVELAFFLESGRAGALLEGLNGREALWPAVISSGLRAAEAKARATEASARKALQNATVAGDIKTVRARRIDLKAAQEKVSQVIARIQREAKASASVVYPEAATLDEIRATLSDGDVLVLYGMPKTEACALVITQAAACIVSLGESAPIHAAVEALGLDAKRGDAKATLATLAKLVVDPLDLPEGAKRLLVSPAGVLGYVPFAALIPAVPVTYVPSGTTYRLLLEDQTLHGAGVLALGDPDYETRLDERTVAVFRGGRRLAPLPATREEVGAIGTEVLLGGDATEAAFTAAAARQPRWRAVHFACHGLVNTERPALSSLALTPGGDDDGFLTCLDLFQLKIPADLVVLSACETARGRVVKTEGIVGMVRAFMFAGAPRVICSLWKVDDEATRALMVKFYELWNPIDGSEGLSTAEALRAAQDHVRTYEREVIDRLASQREGHTVMKTERPWEHPYYWAAWVLWGLPA